jgi:pilus assembly protein Flp/PilA
VHLWEGSSASQSCTQTTVKWLSHLHFDLDRHARISAMACPLRLGRRGRGHASLKWPLSEHWRVRIGRPERTKERDLMNFIARLRALLRDSSGQDLLEYALLVALIALVCVVVITSTGTNVQTIFQRISTALQTATPAAP